MPAGTWYELPVNPNDTQAQVQECLNEPLFFWDVPGAPLPGIEIPPQTLAQLALAKMNVPQAGKMILSPRSGNSYSNLPTFSRVTLSFRPEFGPGGLPYVTDNAQLGDRARERHRRLRRHLPPARHVEHQRHADLAGLLGRGRPGRPATGRLQPGPRCRPRPG
jgi:hypothetical protein